MYTQHDLRKGANPRRFYREAIAKRPGRVRRAKDSMRTRVTRQFFVDDVASLPMKEDRRKIPTASVKNARRR